MTKRLLITGCTDPHMWYSRMVGQLVDYCGEWPGDGYKSREPAGHSNVVRLQDAEVVELDDRDGLQHLRRVSLMMTCSVTQEQFERLQELMQEFEFSGHEQEAKVNCLDFEDITKQSTRVLDVLSTSVDPTMVSFQMAQVSELPNRSPREAHGRLHLDMVSSTTQALVQFQMIRAMDSNFDQLLEDIKGLGNVH